MSNKPNWQKKEIRDAKDFGAYVTKASGRVWNDPGDSQNKDWLIESKYTDKKSYSVSLKTWKKLEKQALIAFRLPLLSVQMQDTEVVVLDKEDFIKLLNK